MILNHAWHGSSFIYSKKSDGRDEKVRAKVLQSINRSNLCCTSGACCSCFYTIRNAESTFYPY